MRNVFLLTGLVSLSLFCRAQSAPPAVHLYAGANLSAQTTEPFGTYSRTQFGPALTGGVELSPRLALQLSDAYTWRHTLYHDEYTTPAGVVATDYDTYDRTFTVPVLLRATLTKSTTRWRVDALVGPTFFFYSRQQTYVQTAQGQPTRSGNNDGGNTEISLTLGPGVRYALTPHLELVADALLGLNVSGFPYTLAVPLTSQLSSQLLAGLHYRLGR